MIWKMLAVACITVAFASAAQAECGDTHGTTVSSQVSTSDTNKLAASTQTGTDNTAGQASSGQAVHR